MMFVIFTSALYGFDIVLPVIWNYSLPFWSLHVLVAFYKPLLVHIGFALSDRMVSAVMNLLIVVGTIVFAFKLGKKIGDSSLWWKILFFFAVPPIILQSIYRYILLPRISSMSNVELLLLAAIVNPLLNEVGLILARELARSLHAKDESVLGIVPCAMMAMKKCVGRYVCYLITDPTIAALASVAIALTEVLFAVHVAVRDRWVYQLQAYFAPIEDKKEAIRRVMNARKNELLRIRFAHNETSMEICYSVTSLIMILTYAVSLDGANLPEIGPLLANFAVQWSSEMIVDLLVVVWLTVICKKPVLAVAHKLFRGWTIAMAFFVWFGNGYFMAATVPLFTYAHMSGGEPKWFLLSQETQDQMMNATALCAQFPSPANQFCE